MTGHAETLREHLLHALLLERFGKPVREHRVERCEWLPTVAQELDWLKHEQQETAVHDIGGVA